MRDRTSPHLARLSLALLASPAVVLMATGLAAVALAMAGSPPAEAAFPGANGQIVFASNRTSGAGVDNPTGDLELFVMNPDGSSVTQLTKNTEPDNSPAISPDGDVIAYAGRDEGADYEIRLWAFGFISTLTDNQVDDSSPAWSPNGQKLAFTRDAGDSEVFVSDLDTTTDDETNITDNSINDFDPAWSPIGGRIAFARGPGFDTDVFLMRPNGSSRDRLTNTAAAERNPSWSPNGAKLAFDRDQDVVLKMNNDGTNRTVLATDRAGAPAWSPDGTKLAFHRARNPLTNPYDVFVMKADGSRERNRTPSGAFFDINPDWQPIPGG